MAATSVAKLYGSVIDDVINNVREAFLDDGIDEQVLLDLKQTWERKLIETRAIDHKETENSSQSGGHSSNSGNQSQNMNNNTNQNQQQSRQSNASSSRNSHSTQNNVVNNQQPQQHQPSQGNVSSQQQSNLSPSNRVLQQQQHSQQQAKQPPAIQQHQSPQLVQRQQQQTVASQQQQVSTASNSQYSAAAVVASRQNTSVVNQPISLAAAPGLVQPTALFQYAPAGDGNEKTVTLVPQKVAFTYNPQAQAIQTLMSTPAATATLALPPELTASLLQQFNPNNVIGIAQNATAVPSNNNTNMVGNIQYQASSTGIVNQRPSAVQNNAPRPSQPNRIVQLDGPIDSSDDDEDEDDYRDNDDDHEENEEEQNDEDNDYTGEEEDPLNSEDDVSDEDPSELFDTDNVVVCQYDKITRSRNKWKFHLKDGIMNLQGKDYVFQKAMGDAEW